MKLTYLGTAAAEGWPAVFCNCEYCLRAKKLGGKNIRTRSQALINDDLLIEFNSDTYSHMLNNRLDISKVRFCFITHSHLDHFQPTDLVFRENNVYSHNMAVKTIKLYGNKAVNEKYKRFFNAVGSEERPPMAEIFEIKPYEKVSVGDYEITPLPANHAEGEDAFVFLVENGGKALLYLHDTGLLSDEVYDYLKANGVRADLISYDCTYVALRSGGGHLGLDSVPEVRKRLEDIGVSHEKTISVVNHFSHNGKLLHDELCAEAEKIGCMTSYDGFTVEF